MKKLEETEQLATLTNSNQLALESLFDGYYDRIYAYCVHRLFCRTTAEDITSQIFLNAAKGFGSVSGDGPEIHVRWLYGIVSTCEDVGSSKITRKNITISPTRLNLRRTGQVFTLVSPNSRKLNRPSSHCVFLKIWAMTRLPASSKNGKRRCGSSCTGD